MRVLEPTFFVFALSILRLRISEVVFPSPGHLQGESIAAAALGTDFGRNSSDTGASTSPCPYVDTRVRLPAMGDGPMLRARPRVLPQV